MEEFIKFFKTVIGAATEYGIKPVPLAPIGGESPFRDAQHHDDFKKSCHRGYEKAQSPILRYIQ